MIFSLTINKIVLLKIVSFMVCKVFAEIHTINYMHPSMCGSNMRYDTSKLTCVSCGGNSRSSCLTRDSAGYGCTCKVRCRLINITSHGVHCEPCPYPQTTSVDGRDCVSCHESNPFSSATGTCQKCSPGKIKIDRQLNGTLSFQKCISCKPGTQPNEERTMCVPCLDPLLTGESTCNCPTSRETVNGYCFRKSDVANVPDKVSLYNIKYNVREQESAYFCDNARAMVALCQIYGNLTACQSLANMCVMLHYRYLGEPLNVCIKHVELLSSSATITVTQWPQNSPWLYYMTETAEETLHKKDIEATYSFRKTDHNSVLNFTAATYSLDGNFLDLAPVTGATLQLCPAPSGILNAAFNFGGRYERKCKIAVRSLWHDYMTVFYDLYLYQNISGKNPALYSVPVRIINYVENGNKVNEGSSSSWKLFRRFYLVDNVSGKTPCSDPQLLAAVVRYAKSIVIRIEMYRNGYEASRIFAPLVSIEYDEATIEDYNADGNVEVSFTVIYEMDRAKEEMDFSIAVGVLSSLAIIYSAIETWSWSKRSGKLGIDSVALGKFILFVSGNLGTIFLTVTFFTCFYLFIFFKNQAAVYVILPSQQQETTFIILLIVAGFLKFVQVAHIFYVQVTSDIFFIDWEKPKARRTIPHPTDKDFGQKDMEEDFVSIWRTYLVANEWSELQTIRKTSLGFQILITLLFLKVVGLENLASADSSVSLSLSPHIYHAPESFTCRIAIGIGTFGAVAILQSIFVFLYERVIGNKIKQFVDLCSMSNISVFVMIAKQFGFYIHGRSVHGHADTNMKTMHQQLKREEDNLCSQRGLLPNNDHQTFLMSLQTKLRAYYDQVMSQLIQNSPTTERLISGQGLPGINMGTGIEKSIEAYQTMNKFLGSFLDHALRDLDYVVKEKSFMEVILDIEFQEPSDKGLFYQDNGHSYDGALLYGYEFVLTTFDNLLFILIDLAVHDFILAGIITFLTGKVTVIDFVFMGNYTSTCSNLKVSLDAGSDAVSRTAIGFTVSLLVFMLLNLFIKQNCIF